MLATTCSILPFDLLLSISFGGGGGLDEDPEPLSFSGSGGGPVSSLGLEYASGRRGRSDGGAIRRLIGARAIMTIDNTYQSY